MSKFTFRYTVASALALLLLGFQNCTGSFGSSFGSLASSSGISQIRTTQFASTVNSSVQCDGQTDVTSRLQAEINSAAGQTNWVLPAGQTCVIHGLKIPSNSHITVNGKLFLAAHSDISLIDMSSVSDVTVDGSGTLDGNRANQSTACGSSAGCAGVQAWSSSNVAVSGLTIVNVANWPVNLVNVQGASMQNMVLKDSGDSVEFAGSTSNCQASGLTISNINDEGFAFYGAVSNCSLSNSQVSSSSADGVSILNDGGQDGICSNITISHVESFNNAISGLAIDTGNGGHNNHNDIVIDGVNLHNNNQSNVGSGGGFRNMSGNNVRFTNSQIHDDGVGSAATYAIYASSKVIGMVIDHVTIENEAKAYSSATGIQIDGATNVSITNSTIDNGSPATLLYAINGTPGAGFAQSGNTFGPTINSGIGSTGSGGAAASSSLAAAPATNNSSPGAVDTSYSQLVPGQFYQIKSAVSQKCLDVAGGNQANGAVIQQYDCISGDANQNWQVVASPVGGWMLVSQLNGKCLDFRAGAINTNGNVVQTWDCLNSANQAFAFGDQGGATYNLQSLAATQCVDVPGGRTGNSLLMQTWTCNSGPDQQFYFVHVN